MTAAIIPLTSEQLQKALTLRDLSDPAQGPHAMQLLLDSITETLTRQLAVALRLERPNPVVSIKENYDELCIDEAAATRAIRYTRYVNDELMLRSHTSAALPSLLKSYERRGCGEVLLAVPGLVYRRDQVDKTHVGEPHQLDLWTLSSERELTTENLEQVLGLIAQTVLPGAQWRVTPAIHPYTINGLQLDVLLHGEWLELGEGGLIHPEILARAGLLNKASGIAVGIGLDRALMLRKGIEDIRYLRSSHGQVIEQLQDLEPWVPVSSQPAAKRAISIARNKEISLEELGDQCRLILGDDATMLEEVTIASVTQPEDLPQAAWDRLGLASSQINMLIEVTLRPLEQTLSAREANGLRDKLYLGLHEGTNKSELTNS